MEGYWLKKPSARKPFSFLVVLLLLSSFFIGIAYLSANPPNRFHEDIPTYTRIITITYGGRSHYYANGTQYYPEEETTTEEEEINPFRPIRQAPLASGKYLIEPTSFTDAAALWSNEADAYDWDNGTNADLGSKNDCDLDLITWNTTDNEGETITRVDIRFRIDAYGFANDEVTISWYVGATQGVGTYTINSGNEGSDIEVTFNDVSEPNDASWSWTDIGNINVRTHYEKNTGSDASTVGIDECWGWVTVQPAAPDTTDPDISSPSDQEVEYGSTGNSIEWTVGDQNPDDYRIYRNDSIVEEGSWTNGTIDADSGECDGLAVGVYNFTAFVNDTSNNFAVDTCWFTVSDTTAPSLDSPSDDQYNEGSSDNTITWTCTELSPNDYIVYRNETEHESGTYSNGVPIVVDIDGLSLGVYNFTMWVDDDYGYTDTDLVWITVVDQNNPSLDSPSDDTIELGSTSDDITWTCTETNEDSYIVYYNDSTWESGSYTSGVPIVVELDGLGLGLWNFTIWVNDTTGNTDTDIVWILCEDSVSPILDSPSDDTIELGSTTDDITWVCTDLDPDNFIVYYNSSEWDSGSWESDVEIVIELDGLTLGLWNFTIICFDGSGNSDTNLVWITCEDTTSPILDSPSDDTIELGSTTDDITWVCTDLDSDNFIVYYNSSEWDSGSWTSGVGIDIELDGLTLGLWNFTIICFDGSGNSDTNLVWITCEDTQNPEIDNPSDDSYTEGSTGNSITWVCTDLDSDNFIVYKNETEWDSGSWTSGVGIEIDIDGLSVAIYNFTIICYDGSDNFVIDLVWITVTLEGDEDNPIFDSPPADDSYELGSTSNTIDWNATDVNPDTYVIYRNDTPIDDGSYTNDTYISINIDGLSLGIYNFTCYVNDTYGNWVVDLVWIEVFDSTSPILDSPSDDTIELGSTDEWVNWTCTDLDPDTFIVYYNSSTWDSGSWTSGIAINVSLTDLPLGLWNFTIICFDGSGNSDTNLVWITCEDTTSPILDSPSDDTVELGSTSDSITWVCTDLDSDNFIVYYNSSEWDSGSWTSGVGIEIELDGLTLGLWNFTIICFDGSGNSDVDLVWITCEDSVSPILDSPSDDTIELGSTTDDITWIGTDLDPDNFIVYYNSSEWDSGSWESDVEIVIELDGLTLGLWNFTIIIFDGSGNHDSNLVWITCEDTTNPEIDNPSDVQYPIGDTGNWVNWTCSDLDSDTFEVFKNTSSYDSGSWESGIAINITVDGFALGLWNLTIICFDGTGNFIVDLVWVTVTPTDSIDPVLNNPANMTIIEGTTGNVIIWIATDDYPDNYTVYCDLVPFDSGSWESGVDIVISIDGLAAPYTWNITIIVQDEVGNTAVDSVFVTIIQSESRDPFVPIPTTPTEPSEELPVFVIIIIIVIIITLTLAVMVIIYRKTT